MTIGGFHSIGLRSLRSVLPALVGGLVALLALNLGVSLSPLVLVAPGALAIVATTYAEQTGLGAGG